MAPRFFSRRDFIKVSSLGLLGFALPPISWPDVSRAGQAEVVIGRVTTSLIYIYSEPSYTAERVGKHYRDQLINLLEEIRSPDGPRYNPRWYRIEGGYVHSAYIQRVPARPQNEPLAAIPDGGLLAEVTVPFVRTFYQSRDSGWQPLYRLYYESIHWITAVREAPDGQVWYRLSDPKNDSIYYAPAAALRPLDSAEFGPIAREVPGKEKRIVISIDEQTVTAYEGERVVLHTAISSGMPDPDAGEDEIPTDTPKGYYRITQKMPSRHMGDGHLTADISAYELPGVPWTMAFHKTGVALHGSFWHDNFGHRMSHGCVNMRNADALWLFRWTEPIYEPVTWYTNGLGTLVQVV